MMTFSQSCLKSRQTEWRVNGQTKIWQFFIMNILKKPNKTLSFDQLHYMLTGEKTRREANKKIMGMERKKPQNRSNEREPESVFFHWASGEGNIIQNSPDSSSQGSALVPDKTRKVTDYVTFTNATTSEGWPNVDSTLARAHNFSSFLANFNITKFCT